MLKLINSGALVPPLPGKPMSLATPSNRSRAIRVVDSAKVRSRAGALDRAASGGRLVIGRALFESRAVVHFCRKCKRRPGSRFFRQIVLVHLVDSKHLRKLFAISTVLLPVAWIRTS